MFYLCMALCLSRPASRAPPASRNAVTAGARAAFWQVVEQDPGGGVLLSNHKSCLLCLQPRGGEKTERGRSRHKSSVTLPLHLSHSVLVGFFFLWVFIYLFIYYFLNHGLSSNLEQSVCKTCCVLGLGFGLALTLTLAALIIAHSTWKITQ